MRSTAVDRRSPSVSRRDFILATGFALASTFTSIAGTFVDWLTRACHLDGDLHFASPG